MKRVDPITPVPAFNPPDFSKVSVDKKYLEKLLNIAYETDESNLPYLLGYISALEWTYGINRTEKDK